MVIPYMKRGSFFVDDFHGWRMGQGEHPARTPYRKTASVGGLRKAVSLGGSEHWPRAPGRQAPHILSGGAQALLEKFFDGPVIQLALSGECNSARCVLEAVISEEPLDLLGREVA
jgi:hypothetical protein